jgi:hypothetical protein
MKYIEINLIKKSSSNFTKIVAIIINPITSIFTKKIQHNNAPNFGYVKDLFHITTLGEISQS